MKVYLWTNSPLEMICGKDGDNDPLVCGALQRRDCEEDKECIFAEGDYDKCRPLAVEIKECSRYGKAQARKALE